MSSHVLKRPAMIQSREESSSTTSSSGSSNYYQPRASSISPEESKQMEEQRDKVSVQLLNKLLDAYPKAVRTDSEGGRLPLHTAIAGHATPPIIRVLLQAYPDAARCRSDSQLPLHLIARWGVSHIQVAILVLEKYPEALHGRNKWERTPMEEALSMAGENGRPHQTRLLKCLRSTYHFGWNPPPIQYPSTTHPHHRYRPSKQPLHLVDVDETIQDDPTHYNNHRTSSKSSSSSETTTDDSHQPLVTSPDSSSSSSLRKSPNRRKFLFKSSSFKSATTFKSNSYCFRKNPCLTQDNPTPSKVLPTSPNHSPTNNQNHNQQHPTSLQQQQQQQQLSSQCVPHPLSMSKDYPQELIQTPTKDIVIPSIPFQDIKYYTNSSAIDGSLCKIPPITIIRIKCLRDTLN